MAPISGPKITILLAQASLEGQNMISKAVIIMVNICCTRGPIVICDMSLLANCVVPNLFLVFIMSFSESVTLKALVCDLQTPYQGKK